MEKYLFYSSGALYSGIQTGGVKRCKELINSALARKQNICFASQDSEDITNNKGFNRFFQLKEGKHTGLLNLLPPEFQVFLTNIGMIKTIKKSKFDRVVVFDVPPAVGLVLLRVKNIVLMIRKDLIGYEKTINHRWSLYPKLVFLWVCESLCMMRSKKVVCQCYYDKHKLMKRHPIIAYSINKKTLILINNVNPSWVIENKHNVRNVIQLSPKEMFRVCFIGNFDTPRKGHQLLLDAAIDILKYNKDIEFVLIGGGESLDHYRMHYANERIIFTGKLSEPIVVMKQCDMLVVPSYADSCPNTVMEALYYEIPVIGSKAGGIPEILIDNEALFDLNKASLIASILKYKSSPDDLNHLRLKQIERKEQLTFDWGNKMLNLIIS